MHALLFALAMTVPTGPAPNAHFQIAFRRTASGYDAECASGCRWTALSFECGDTCRAVIDEGGVRVGAETKDGDPVFAFRFQRTATGFELTSLGGTGWEDLAWSCGLLPCTAHVDERSVSGSAVGG